MVALGNEGAARCTVRVVVSDESPALVFPENQRSRREGLAHSEPREVIGEEGARGAEPGFIGSPQYRVDPIRADDHIGVVEAKLLQFVRMRDPGTEANVRAGVDGCALQDVEQVDASDRTAAGPGTHDG